MKSCILLFSMASALAANPNESGPADDWFQQVEAANDLVETGGGVFELELQSGARVSSGRQYSERIRKLLKTRT